MIIKIELTVKYDVDRLWGVRLNMGHELIKKAAKAFGLGLLQLGDISVILDTVTKSPVNALVNSHIVSLT